MTTLLKIVSAVLTLPAVIWIVVVLFLFDPPTRQQILAGVKPRR